MSEASEDVGVVLSTAGCRRKKEGKFWGAAKKITKSHHSIGPSDFFAKTVEQKKVEKESMFDVASLTKVLSTTPVVMKLIQKKILFP